MSSTGTSAANGLLSLLQDQLHLSGQLTSRRDDFTVTCGDNTYAKCPRYSDGCFDYGPMYCKGAQPFPASPPPTAWTSPKQPPAKLWKESPAPNLTSSLSFDVQFCIRDACDALEPTQASLCYCHGTSNDPSLCDPPLGLALPMAVAAHAVCSSNITYG